MKETINIIYQSNIPYSKRVYRAVKNLLFAEVILFSIGLVIMEIQYALILPIMGFIIEYIEVIRWYRFYIIRVELLDNKLNILYKNKDEDRRIDGYLSDFSVEKKFVWYKIRSRVPYLKVYYKGELKFKQYGSGNLDEKKMDELVKLF